MLYFSILILQNFDRIMQLSKLDPDWNAAHLHGISTLPGRVDQNKPKEDIMICPCCLNSIHKQPAPLCENSKELEFLGFGFPLFYVFIKYCIILLLVTICSYNALELYWAVEENDVNCNNGVISCTSFMIYFSRIEETVDNAEVVIRIFSFVVQLGVLLYIRDLITKTRNYYDERTCSLSDYSILLTNLPEKKGTRARLIQLLQSSLGKSFKAYQITFLPEYEDFYRMEEEVNEIINRVKDAMSNSQSPENDAKIEKLNLELSLKENQLTKYCEGELTLEEKDECIAEKVIFSCATEDEKDQIIERFKELPPEKLKEAFGIAPEEECKVEIKEAPEPKEINWEHINYPEQKRLFRMVIGWVLTILFLSGITAIFFFVLSEKSILIEESLAMHESATTGSTGTDSTSHTTSSSSTSTDSTSHSTSSSYSAAIFLVYISLVSVIFFNKFVMGLILHRICDFERHMTTAEEEFHFALKYSVGMFFTTALMTLAVEDLRFHNFYQHPYGVIEEETVMFFMNALFVPFIWFINPWQITVLLKRHFNEGRKDLTQKEANKLMENVQYNMGKRYAEIIEIMWFTFLYSSLIPFGAFLSILGLCLYYWIDKYNLLRRSSVNSNIAGQLSLFSMKLLDFTLFCKPIGELIFDTQIRHSYCTSSVVMCIVALLYLILPIDNILEAIHPEKFKNEEKSYEDVQSNFKETYQTLHPIFSLKEENQEKLQKAFKLIDTLFSIPVHAYNHPNHTVDVESVNEDVASAHQMAPLRDSTNVLQTFFKKNNKVSDEFNYKE